MSVYLSYGFLIPEFAFHKRVGGVAVWVFGRFYLEDSNTNDHGKEGEAAREDGSPWR